MGFSFIERQVLKGFGWRLKRMESVRRYLPLASVFVLVLETVIRLLGYTDAAQAIQTVRNLVGLSPDQETVAMVGVLGTAVTGAGVGLYLKVRALIRAARA
jgi:hypothetical protein